MATQLLPTQSSQLSTKNRFVFLFLLPHSLTAQLLSSCQSPLLALSFHSVTFNLHLTNSLLTTYISIRSSSISTLQIFSSPSALILFRLQSLLHKSLSSTCSPFVRLLPFHFTPSLFTASTPYRSPSTLLLHTFPLHHLHPISFAFYTSTSQIPSSSPNPNWNTPR
jgi:hypothetical protein